MNILFVIRSWSLGGEQRALSLLSAKFTDEAHRVQVLVLDRPSDSAAQITSDSRVRRIFVDSRSTHRSRRVVRLIAAVRQQVGAVHPDVVVGFGAGAAIIACLALAGLKTPIVVCERNDPARMSLIWRVTRRIAYLRASGAVFQTKEAEAYFTGRSPSRSVVIPNPVHPESRRLRASHEEQVIVNTSRLTGPKNQRMLVQAFSRVAKLHPDYELQIFGDGPERASLEDLVKSLGLQSRVQLRRPETEILPVLSRSRIFVLTSDHEGFPNSLAEAMSLGLACIATDCRIGGPRSMITDGYNGRLVQPGDVDSLTAVLSHLMANPQEIARLGLAARQWASALEVGPIASQWLTFLESVASQGKDGFDGSQ